MSLYPAIERLNMECKFEQVALVHNCASAYLLPPCGMCFVSLDGVVKKTTKKTERKNTGELIGGEKKIVVSHRNHNFHLSKKQFVA